MLPQQAKKESTVISETPAYEGKWLGLKYINYSIGERVVTNYEAAYRTTTKHSGRAIDGVEVIPVIKSTGRQARVVMIANFRPPVGKFVLEFPSGLVESEDYEENASREVLEETGYVVSKFVQIPHPVMHCDPWKSNESGLFYLAIIDGDDPAHFKGQRLEDQENIVVHVLDLNDRLLEQVEALVKEKGYALEGKVWSVCLGLRLMSLISQ